MGVVEEDFDIEGQNICTICLDTRNSGLWWNLVAIGCTQCAENYVVLQVVWEGKINVGCLEPISIQSNLI